LLPVFFGWWLRLERCGVDTTKGGECMTLRRGDKSKEVRELKSALAILRYMSHATVNDSYDANTQESVRMFQEDNGIEATGIFDDETKRAINKALARKG
jgi:peptidoglycan hydrolase-like protein with peptidoglycan-binding domain